MNIVVQTHNDFTVVRPDITWERYNRDFYVPDFIKGLLWVPVAYAPVIRPGKFIQTQFAGRYIASTAYGVLFYADDAFSSPEAFAQACCLNHSSLLPEPYPEHSVSGAADVFSFEINDAQVFRADLDADPFIKAALASASRRVLLRNGDIMALELAAPAPLEGTGPFHFTGKFSLAENPLLDFNVII